MLQNKSNLHYWQLTTDASCTLISVSKNQYGDTNFKTCTCNINMYVGIYTRYKSQMHLSLFASMQISTCMGLFVGIGEDPKTHCCFSFYDCMAITNVLYLFNHQFQIWCEHTGGETISVCKDFGFVRRWSKRNNYQTGVGELHHEWDSQLWVP